VTARISFARPAPTRPGVSPQNLEAANVRHVGAADAERLCGISQPGLWIPYRKPSGDPVHRDTDGPQPFGRLRLDTARDGHKYHQRAGSKAYGYLPHNLHELTAQPDLVVVEGEFKAMSLAEAGVAAVGIGGINLAVQEGQLVPGLREILHDVTFSRVLFLGDGDTSLIFDFSREAVKLAKALGEDVPVLLPRIGLDGPGKGIDDVREAIGTEAFPAYWAQLVANAEPVHADDSAEKLAVRLLKRESAEALRKAAA
jgi:hypothetical protein